MLRKNFAILASIAAAAAAYDPDTYEKVEACPEIPENMTWDQEQDYIGGLTDLERVRCYPCALVDKPDDLLESGETKQASLR